MQLVTRWVLVSPLSGYLRYASLQGPNREKYLQLLKEESMFSRVYKRVWKVDADEEGDVTNQGR